MQKKGISVAAVFVSILLGVGGALAESATAPSTYRHFQVETVAGRVVAMKPIPDSMPPLWAANVSQKVIDWDSESNADDPYFQLPIPFVWAPSDSSEPFHRHNHQPAITWLANGDLLAIWYSTGEETGTELTVLASRLRSGQKEWDPSSEFFKAPNRNMHGSSIFHDGKGKVYHINGMAPEGALGWDHLALLLRTSTNNGVTWTAPRSISSGAAFQQRHQVIAGTLITLDGNLVQACDATHGGEGPTAIHISRDDGRTWTDPGGDIRGIHAGVTSLKGGRLLALGRAQALGDRMPMSISADSGKTWKYKASPFPPIGSGQRLVLKRLLEGPIMVISFTSNDRLNPEANGMTFIDQNGNKLTGHGMYAALSFDEGQTWPVRKLLTPGEGEYDGGAHTGPFTSTRTRAEHAGYLAAIQTPDRMIHLISSRLHYQFNLAWLTAGTETIADEVRP